jgi:hypothetical protein
VSHFYNNFSALISTAPSAITAQVFMDVLHLEGNAEKVLKFQVSYTPHPPQGFKFTRIESIFV